MEAASCDDGDPDEVEGDEHEGEHHRGCVDPDVFGEREEEDERSDGRDDPSDDDELCVAVDESGAVEDDEPGVGDGACEDCEREDACEHHGVWHDSLVVFDLISDPEFEDRACVYEDPNGGGECDHRGEFGLDADEALELES